MEDSPEKISFFDSLRSIRDLGKLAVAEVINKLGEIPGRIDTYYANQPNGEEDES